MPNRKITDNKKNRNLKRRFLIRNPIVKNSTKSRNKKAPTKMLRIGINDVFGESGPAVQLLAKYGIDAEGIYEKVKAFV